MSQTVGFIAEAEACRYLHKQGLTLVMQNYRCRCGEIDLIMRDGEYWVFVEVRARASGAFGGGVASVTYRKKQKLIKTATLYLMTKKIYDKVPVRFDIVAMEGKPPVIVWLKNAFGTDF